MILFKITIAFLLLVQFTQSIELTVDTTYGLLHGREYKSRNGRTVAAFSGIPFAKPPIGLLRFQDPQPPEPWYGIRDASNFGSVCVQIPFLYPPVSSTKLGNEDCLYLSVYTPTVNPTNLLPVLVLLHGGGFAFGSGELDKTPEFFMDHDIVVVMPNYRLGPIGFLTMEDDILPGNMGLKDQNMALVWVHNNIANFGGNPGKVTLIGESAGGASVHYQMLSPMSRGLFHRAISMSGTALCPWGNVAPGLARSRTIKMAQLFNCSTESSKVILECLRTKNAFELIKILGNFSIPLAGANVVMPPIIDKNATNPFMPFNPYTAEPAPVPWIVGVASLEGILKTGALIRNGALDEFDKQFYDVAPISMYYGDTAINPQEVSKKIREFYFGDQPISNFVLSNLTDMFSDNQFLWQIVKSLHRHKGPQYFYYFDYLGENSFQELLATKRISRGATHTDDTIYIWKINNPTEIEAPQSDPDLNLSHLLLKLFVNFMTTGNPTPSGAEFNWPLWDNQTQNFVSFENRGVFFYKKFLPNRMQFWDSLNIRNKVEPPCDSN